MIFTDPCRERQAQPERFTKRYTKSPRRGDPTCHVELRPDWARENACQQQWTFRTWSSDLAMGSRWRSWSAGVGTRLDAEFDDSTEQRGAAQS